MPTLFVAAVSISEDYRDISPVTLRHIAESDFVIGEERKSTLRLLAISNSREKDFYLLNEHTTESERLELVNKVSSSDKVVFFSDAGTPCISDPDYKFILMCRQSYVEIKSLAGASSITAAISISGIDASQFQFLGFPPKDKLLREAFFDSLKRCNYTTIFMERPYALVNVLQEMIDFNLQIFIAINLSSENEECYFDKPSNIINKLKIKKAPFIIIIPKQSK